MIFKFRCTWRGFDDKGYDGFDEDEPRLVEAKDYQEAFVLAALRFAHSDAYLVKIELVED